MADGVAITPGLGATIATDDVGGIQYQRVKVTFGDDGSATDASATNPLPVSLTGTVPVSGTFWQATQPVSLANLPALAAGANVIGGVTQSGTWNVGVTGSVSVTGTFWQATQPVSLVSQPLPTGAATEATLASALTKLTSIDTGVNATVSYLPPTPLIATTDLTPSMFLSSSASGENATPLVAANATLSTRIHRLRVTAAGAATVTFLDGSGGTVLYTLEFPAAGAYVLDFSERYYFKSSVNKAIVLSSSAAVKVTAGAAYVQA